jgi:hypothetical protein
LDNKIKEDERDSVCVNAGLANCNPQEDHIIYDQPERHSSACIYQKEGGIEFTTTTLLFTNSDLH